MSTSLFHFSSRALTKCKFMFKYRLVNLSADYLKWLNFSRVEFNIIYYSNNQTLINEHIIYYFLSCVKARTNFPLLHRFKYKAQTKKTKSLSGAYWKIRVKRRMTQLSREVGGEIISPFIGSPSISSQRVNRSPGSFPAYQSCGTPSSWAGARMSG